MQAEISPNGAATFIVEAAPGTDITYSESVDACGPATATIAAYLTDAQQAAILGADVILRSAVDVEWFGRVDSYKNGVLTCAGKHAGLSDVPRPADYVNSHGVGFRPVAESAEAARYSKDLVANVGDDGKVSVSVTSGSAIAAGYTGAWWFPRFANVRDASANAASITWHRHTVANYRLRVYSCTSTGLRGDKLWEQAAGTGSTDGTVTADDLANTGSNAGNGYLFYIEVTTGYTPGVNATSFIQPRIYDLGVTASATYIDMTPNRVMRDAIQGGDRESQLANVDDSISTEFDDLMFDLSSTDADKIAEVCKRTGFEFFWRWDTSRLSRPHFRPQPTTPLYYVDATDPNVTADLTFGAVKDYYDGLYVIGQKVRHWGGPSGWSFLATDPWCWHYDDPSPSSNPLTATGIHRAGIVDCTGYTGSQSGIVSAFFADNGRLKVSGTIAAAGVTLLDGTKVNPASIRSNELIRVNTRQGTIDARITQVDHVGELSATITVGDKAQDFESVLARLLGKA